MKNRNTMNIATAILFWLACAALSPKARAIVPAPDGGYPNFNTAEGQNALFSLTTGQWNTALGAFTLSRNTEGSYNTAVGTAALVLNVGNQQGVGIENTAVGAAALLSNTIGSENTAVGVDALLNSDGDNNTAVGAFALVNSTDGNGNTAVGDRALQNATSGRNTAVGRHAGDHITTGSNNVCVGTFSGTAITTGSNIITIGPVSGVHSIFGQGDNRTYIANILNGFVDGNTAQAVYVDADGRLGTVQALAGSEPRLPRPATVKPNPDAQTMLNRKIEELQKQVAALTAELKEQATQIQRMSGRIELSGPVQTVASDQ